MVPSAGIEHGVGFPPVNSSARLGGWLGRLGLLGGRLARTAGGGLAREARTAREAGSDGWLGAGSDG